MNLKKLNNIELIKRCAQEPFNRKVWAEFYNRFDERIWLVVYRECNAKGIVKYDSQYREAIQDLVQDVYVRLIDDNCKALKNFVGASENSIYSYLGIIAKNVVNNYIAKMSAQKRMSFEKLISTNLPKDEKIFIKYKVKASYSDLDDEISLAVLKEEIDVILNKILKSRDKERDKLIFKLHFYEGFSVEDLAEKFHFGLSSKRISNLITAIKKSLRPQLLEQMMEVF